MTLEQLWEHLGQVSSLSFVAKSEKPGGWNGKGSGTVVVQQVNESCMTFTESGVWRPEGGRDTRFHNVFRWSVVEMHLRLEHLRFGEAHPVYLFDLALASDCEWRSVSPHVCREDCYAAILIVTDDHIVLKWSIDGPRKREVIEYRYRQRDPTENP